MRFLRIFLSALLLFVAVAVSAAAQEVIRNFVSDVTIAPDGELTVRETITVNAEGNQIRRGILRDFPTTYTRPDGTRVRVGFEVLKVMRDGRDEPYAASESATRMCSWIWGNTAMTFFTTPTGRSVFSTAMMSSIGTPRAMAGHFRS
jgi:hypothetical protein